MGDCPGRQRRAQESWLINLLKAQEESIHFAENWARASIYEETTPDCPKWKKECSRKWKQERAPWEEYTNISKVFKDGVRKAKGQLGLKLEVIGQ